MILGIDVSSSQAKIDWSSTPDTIKFAYIKSTEGKSFVSRSMMHHASNCPVPFGLYHYANIDNYPEQDANNFMEVLRAVSGWSLVPVLDLESGGDKYDGEYIKSWYDNFCSLLDRFCGTKIMFYSYGSYYKIIEPKDRPLWGAVYTGKPFCFGSRADELSCVDMHQFTSTNIPTLRGWYNKNLDVNACLSIDRIMMPQ